MTHCIIFERYEDELFQQIPIMGLALRLAEKSLNEAYKAEHLKMGLKAADRVDKILEDLRHEKVSVRCTPIS